MFLLLLQSRSADIVCVRVVYPRDIAHRILPEYHQYFSDTGDHCEDPGKETEDFVDGTGGGGLSGLFRAVFEERLQYGYTAAAV